MPPRSANLHAEVETQVFHDEGVEEQVSHVARCRGVTIASRYVPRSFAEDMSTNLLSISWVGDPYDDEQPNDDDDEDSH